MKSALRLIVSALALAACTSVSALIINFENIGFALPSDCTGGAPPQPVCVDLEVFATGNDIPDVIPGTWNFRATGQVLFFQGSGTFRFDDPSAANNDLFGTWTNVLGPPNANGIAQSFFQYLITGGSGLFAGATGFGTSSLDVVVAPFAVDNGVPVFTRACPEAPARIGSFCERGALVIPEPSPLWLLAVGLVALWVTASPVIRSRTGRLRA